MGLFATYLPLPIIMGMSASKNTTKIVEKSKYCKSI